MNMNYQPYKKGYLAWNGKRVFNRALYGRYYEKHQFRLKCFAGDLPEIMLYAGMDLGRLFWGVRNRKQGGLCRMLSECKTIVSIYECGVMTWKLEDPCLGDGVLEIRAVPSEKNHGLLVRITSERMKEDLELVSFYGFASGETAKRGMDAGYAAMGTMSSLEELQASPGKCVGNRFRMNENTFRLHSEKMGWRTVEGHFDDVSGADLDNDASNADTDKKQNGNRMEPCSKSRMGLCSGSRIAGGCMDPDGTEEQYPLFYQAEPLWSGRTRYFLIACPDGETTDTGNLAGQFWESAAYYRRLSERVMIHTPESALNAGMYAANIVVNGFWLDPVFNHGAWSWDVPILGWRSMYGPCLMGMHEEIRKEAELFNGLQLNRSLKPVDPEKLEWVNQAEFANTIAYFDHQSDAMKIREDERVKKPLPDPEWQFARQSAYGIINSEGRVPFMPSAMNIPMYNMQEVYFDQLIYEWENTGDLAFAAKIVGALKRHSAWEIRCFDPDRDGLYENYANYWATDGIFAGGGAGAVATAYNYRLNRKLAELCRALGQETESREYDALADKIAQAFQKKLWSDRLGRMAENADLLGEQLKHYEISAPSIMHCAEAGILDPFKLYQALCYADYELEHVQAGNGEVVWITNWVPYVWSVRDAGFADNMHLALAYFQNGQAEKGFRLLLGAVTAPTCMQVCPGGFSQVLEGKGIDFADTSSMYVRAVTEGLYGIRCMLQEKKVMVSPHFPDKWTQAQIDTPNVGYSYRKGKKKREEQIQIAWPADTTLILIFPVREVVSAVWVNGIRQRYQTESAIGHANIRIEIAAGEPEVGTRRQQAKLVLQYREQRKLWKNAQAGQVLKAAEKLPEAYEIQTAPGETVVLAEPETTEVYDPQKAAKEIRIAPGSCTIQTGTMEKYHTLFLKVRRNGLEYWVPVNLHNTKFCKNLLDATLPGQITEMEQKRIPIENVFNENAADIYRNEYRSPRPDTCSLQVPLHLVPSDWCNVDAAEVDGMSDSLLRESVRNGVFTLENGLTFAQPAEGRNICYLSRWDNYPTEKEFAIHENGEDLYILFTGYTNQMQCGIVNAVFEAAMEDGTVQTYELVAPDNFRNIHKGPGTERSEDRWCYGEQAVSRVRIGNRRAEADAAPGEDIGIYAQVGRIPLHGKRVLSLTVRAVANEIVVGIMGITVVK